MLDYDSDSSAGEATNDAFQINKLASKKPRIDEPSTSTSVTVSAAPDVLLEVRIFTSMGNFVEPSANTLIYRTPSNKVCCSSELGIHAS